MQRSCFERSVRAWVVMSAAASIAAAQPSAPEPAPPTEPTTIPARPVQPPPPGAATAPEARFYTTIRATAEHTFRANLDDSPGDVAVSRIGAGLGVSGPLSERFRLSINLDSETLWYDFNDVAELVPGTDDPISEAYRLSLRPQLVFIQSRQWSWFVGGTVESAGEFDADVGESITGGAFGGVRYQVNPDLALSFGLGAKTRLEDSALILPLIGFEWKLSDDVTLGSDGLGVTLAARMNEDWWFNVTGGLELRDFRLDEDGPLPDGVLRDGRFPLGVGVSWRPSPALSLELLGGAVVWQRYTVHDADGDELTQINTDPTGFVRFSVRWTF